mgnify:CR=1 FL=1
MSTLNTHTMSTTINQAVDDLEKVEKSDNISVDMEEWVKIDPFKGDFFKPTKINCSVCFAGSVMVSRYGEVASKIDKCGPDDFDRELSATFIALDNLRGYYYRQFVETYYHCKLDDALVEYLVDELKSLDLDKKQYHQSPTIFKKNMRKIAKKLKELGV